jgi:CRISPR/Cas system-associated exonuclease Cas4 (RecB family)
MTHKQELLFNYTVARLGFKKGSFLEQYLDYLQRLAINYKYLGAQKAVHKYFELIEEELNLVGETFEEKYSSFSYYIVSYKTDIYEEFTFSGESISRKKYHRIQDETLINNNSDIKKLLVPLNPELYQKYELEGELFVPLTFGSFHYQMLESRNKKNKSFNKKINTNNLISATDLANFTYCPASYSIGKTFETDMVRSAEIGSNFHAQNRLIKWLKPVSESQILAETEDNQHERVLIEDENNKYFFDDIRFSELIYSGHNNNEQKYFINKKGNFVGQPDYVFQNSKGEKFIVEEKFKFKKADNFETFFNNHKVQLASYIYGLDKFEANYGYLIYWNYNFDYKTQKANIVECKVLKISKSDQVRSFLIDTFNSLNIFIKNKKQDFNSENLNPKKCANCVVNRFCGHKTGRFNDLEVPYNDRYLKLESIPFPEELKKEILNDKVPTESAIIEKPKSDKDILNSIDWDT